MDIDGVSAGDNGADDRARMVAITERNHELWDRLGNCQDERLRSQLVDELGANRKELARLKETIGNQSNEPDAASQPSSPTSEPPESVASADSEQADPEPVKPPAEAIRPIVHSAPPLAPASTPFTGREDDLVASRGSRRVEVAASSEPSPEAKPPGGLEDGRRSAHGANQDLKRVRPERGRRFLVFPILVAVGALAVVAWFVFLRGGDSPDTIEAATTADVATEATVVDQIRAVLGGLGHGSLLVEERSGTFYLAGVVDSDNDRSTAISATQALAGDMPLDSSGLTIGGADGSTDPPTTSVPPTEAGGEEQQPVVVPRVFDGPYIEATLDGKDFVLAGVVPSAELADAYLQAAEIAYAPYVRSELTVDEQLESPEWLSRGPEAIIMLPMITEGKILIADDQVQMSGQSPNQAGLDRLEGALGQITGLPVVVGVVDITNLQPPSWVIAADAGAVDLSGEVPTEEIRSLLVEGAAAAYGSDKVQDRMTVNPNVYPSLWMYNGGPLMQAMSTFPDYKLRINGTAFSGHINGNVTFESGSAVFSGNYAQVLDVGVGVLTRDQSLHLVIEGHTDDRGTKASNLALSQARAEAVRDYFIANGIDPSRLTAVGIGEAEPVVHNTSEAGRARNRRIQYILTTSR